MVRTRTSSARFRHERGFNPVPQDHEWKKKGVSLLVSFCFFFFFQDDPLDLSHLTGFGEKTIRGCSSASGIVLCARGGCGRAIGKWNRPERDSSRSSELLAGVHNPQARGQR